MNRDEFREIVEFTEQLVFGLLVVGPVVGLVGLLVYAIGLRAGWWL